MERKYGWIPQPEDSRDLKYSSFKPHAGLPSVVDLRPKMPQIWDQGQLGSCTAHGIGRAFVYAEKKIGLPELMPSRLFLYFNERMEEGTIDQDAGAIIRDGIKACNIYGIADESLWPYDITKFKDKPTSNVYDNAKTDRIRYYASVETTNLDSVKLCMFHGYPIVFGFEVFPNFESYTTGVLQKPGIFDNSLGGHCVCTAGYDDSKQAILVANSWSANWAAYGGYFWMSYSYFTSHFVSDGWMMRLK
jgi:C1A family cysteine protease